MSDNFQIGAALKQAVMRVRSMDKLVTDFPHITQGGEWYCIDTGVWTGGFWAGLLWASYEYDGDERSKQRAIHFTDRLLPRATDKTNHDLGFMFAPSALKGWRLLGTESYRKAALVAAQSLADQYNTSAGYIPGWGFFGGEDWNGKVLIDTLMNLPLLVWAVGEGADPKLLDVVRGQVKTSIENHMRPDGSVYHVFKFVPGTSEPIGGDTYQGYAADSTWSRGQSWALTGLAMLGISLEDASYIAASERAAEYFIANVPADGVPPWDFQAPASKPFKDASAGAIASYGLLRLYDATGKKAYLGAAQRFLAALQEHCANPGEGFGLLLHSTADLPHGLGIDESVIYGDYYYAKALIGLAERLGIRWRQPSFLSSAEE